MANLAFQSLQEARAYLADLGQLKTTESSNTWSIGKSLLHCAQSIDCSMTGFPVHKPTLFKKTIGKLAFKHFYKKGKMKHDLETGIPGIQDPADSTEAWLAIDKLMASIDQFLGFSEELKPHFAYGELTKEQYDKAHAMHIANHLETIEV